MAGRFGPRRRFVPTTGTALTENNFYSMGGLDLYSPDELMKDSNTPFARNFRVFEENDGTDSRVAVSKRLGHTKYSDTVDEASNVAQTSTTGASTVTVGSINWVGQKFTATATNNLSRIAIRARNTASGTAPIIVDVYTDNSGVPGTKLATSSIDQTLLTSSYAYVDVLFIEAPRITSGQVYWFILHQQVEGTGAYDFSTTTTASTAATSANSGNTWSNQSYSLNYTVYSAPGGGVIAQHRFYRTNASPETIFVGHNNSGVGLYKVNDGTGAVTQITGTLSSSAINYEFVNVDNTCYFVNGVDTPKKYTGGASFTDMGGSPGVAISIRLHKAALFLLDSANRVIYSRPDDLELFESTAFIYIPAPDTADYVQYMETFQDNLLFITRNTKYMLYGQDVNTFTLRESTSTKGVVGQKAAFRYESVVYFVSGDDNVYAFNGGTDKAIGLNIGRILANVADSSKIRMHVSDDEIRIYYAPTGQSEQQNCLVDDLDYFQWEHDTEVYVSYAISLNSQTDENELVVGSSRVSRLMFADRNGSDLGKPILFDWWTKYMTYGHPTRKKRIKRLYPIFRAGEANYSVNVDIDADYRNSPIENLVPLGSSGAVWGDGSTWGGGAVWGASNEFNPVRISVPGQNSRYQIRFTQHGVDNPVEIIGFSTYTKLRRPV